MSKIRHATEDYMRKNRPNYNQNDPTQPDYIKNRPFYETESVIMSEDIPIRDTGIAFLQTPFPRGEYNIGDVLKIESTNKTTGEVSDESVVINSLHENGNPRFYVTVGGVIFDMDLDDGTVITCVTESEVFHSSFKISQKTAVPLDEKFIPDSVKHVNPDYSQNDETQPDYIKNRPFGARQQIVGQANLSELTLEDTGEYFIPNTDVSFLQDGDILHIEINDNGTVYKTEAAIEFYNDTPMFVGTHIFVNNDMWLVGLHDEKRLFVVTEVVDGVSIRVYKESVKKLDGKYLPENVINTVPYIYSSDEEPVRVETLSSGVYILHGMFLTYLDVPIYDFYNEPTFCIVENIGSVRLTWFTTSIGENGPTAFVRYMFIQEGEIIFDNSAPLC